MTNMALRTIASWAAALLMLAAVGLTADGGEQPASRGQSCEAADGKPDFGKDLAIYLGCGEVDGPGEVVQVDSAGKVLGRVKLTNSPSGLAVGKDGLVACMPWPMKEMVVQIDAKGKVDLLYDDRDRCRHALAAAANPQSGDVLIADNLTNVLILLPGGAAKDARILTAVPRGKGAMPGMSVAIASDGAYLLGGSGTKGIYRFSAGKAVTLGDPLLPGFGYVAADPSSKRWAATQADDLHLFKEAKEQLKIPYPQEMIATPAMTAFGPDGTLIAIGRPGKAPKSFVVLAADFEAKGFRTLFTWDQSPVESVAVGPRMDWGKP